MRWELSWPTDGESLLARVQDGALCDTPFAHLTLRREGDGHSFRLTVTSSGEDLPEARPQLNRYANSVARQLRETEEWISTLESAEMILRGTSTELCCSVAIGDAALQGKGKDWCDSFRAGASSIVADGLSALLGLTEPWTVVV
jgi:hypothetical protein